MRPGWSGRRLRRHRRGWSLTAEGGAPPGDCFPETHDTQGWPSRRQAARASVPARTLLCREGLRPALSNVSQSEAFNPNEILALTASVKVQLLCGDAAEGFGGGGSLPAG